MISKIMLRKRFQQQRLVMSKSFRFAAAHAIAKHLEEFPKLQRAETVACYMAYKSEVDCSAIINNLWQTNKKVYLPVLTKERTLEFAQYHHDDELKPNRFGILEPLQSASRITPQDLDVILMPLIAYDGVGHRLGTGGGYYDRTLAFLKESDNNKPYLTGLAYSEQKADFIEPEAWDVDLHAIATEIQVLTF